MDLQALLQCLERHPSSQSSPDHCPFGLPGHVHSHLDHHFLRELRLKLYAVVHWRWTLDIFPRGGGSS